MGRRKIFTTPPYVPRTGFKQLMEVIYTKQTGEILQKDDLVKRKVSTHLIYPSLAALRFLKVIDKDDRLLGPHAYFSPVEPNKGGISETVKKAYGDFFDNAKLPSANIEELQSAFSQTYELSERLSNSAFPFFLWMAELGEIELLGNGNPATMKLISEIEKPQVIHNQTINPISAVKEHEPAEISDIPLEDMRVRHTPFQIVLHLTINKFSSERDIIKMIRTAKKAIQIYRKTGDGRPGI